MRNFIGMGWAVVMVVVGVWLSPVAAHAADVNIKDAANLVPVGYKILQEVRGDLNNDDFEDCVLIIEGKKDETRRGIIIAFNYGEHYEIALKNHNIFSYDKDEVAPFVPMVEIAVKKGILNIVVEERFGGGHIKTEWSWFYIF